MNTVNKGWFELDVDCAAGARYQYVLPDGGKIPDPASRAQVDDVQGGSIVVNPNSISGVIRSGAAGLGGKLSFTNCMSAPLAASMLSLVN